MTGLDDARKLHAQIEAIILRQSHSEGEWRHHDRFRQFFPHNSRLERVIDPLRLGKIALRNMAEQLDRIETLLVNLARHQPVSDLSIGIRGQSLVGSM